MSARTPWRLLAVPLVVALLAGCSPDGEPSRPVVVRLFDIAAEEDLRLWGDPAAPGAVLRSGLPGGQGREGAIIDGTRPARELWSADGATLTLEPGADLMEVLPASADQALLVSASLASGAAFVSATPLRAQLTPAELADPSRLAELVVGEALGLSAVSPLSGEVPASLRVPAHPGTRALLLVVRAEDGPAELSTLDVAPLSPVASRLRGSGASLSGGHLLLSGEAREARALPVGSQITWQLDVPPRSPVLDLALGRLGLDLPVGLRWSLRAPGVRRDGGFELTPDDHGDWHEQVIDLADVAGRRVALTLAVTGLADDPGDLALALGNPVLRERLPDQRDPRPDVVLVSLDTLRADRVGPDVQVTPQLAALCATSLRFTDAVATSSWTLPSHVSLLTGRWAGSHGAVRFDRRPVVPEASRLAGAFRAAGYETIAVTGGGYMAPFYGLADGFERYGVVDPGRRGVSDDGTPTRDTPARRDLLERLGADRERPRFVLVHTYAVHHGDPLPHELAAVGGTDAGLSRLRQGLLRRGSPSVPGPRDATLAEDAATAYDALAVAGDELLRDVLAAVARSPRADRTVLVVTSDHGQELFDHGAFGHGHALHPELVQVPLLMRVPGVAPGEVSAPVSLVDLAPTLRDLAGLPADPDAHGLSLRTLWEGGALPDRLRLAHLARHGHPDHHLLRLGDLSLRARDRADGSLEVLGLYDRRSDPGEELDVASQRPDETARLLERLSERLSRDRPTTTSPVVLDAEARHRLAELGYLSDG